MKHFLMGLPFVLLFLAACYWTGSSALGHLSNTPSEKFELPVVVFFMLYGFLINVLIIMAVVGLAALACGIGSAIIEEFSKHGH